jgi:hypothetical protein
VAESLGNNELLAAGVVSDNFALVHFLRINLTSHQATDLDHNEVADNPFAVVWFEPGKAVLFPRTVNGLTNIWKVQPRGSECDPNYFRNGPGLWPMPEPDGRRKLSCTVLRGLDVSNPVWLLGYSAAIQRALPALH